MSLLAGDGSRSTCRPRRTRAMRSPTSRAVVNPSRASVNQPIGNVPGGFQIATQRSSSVVYTSPNGSDARSSERKKRRELAAAVHRVREEPRRERVVIEGARQRRRERIDVGGYRLADIVSGHAPDPTDSIDDQAVRRKLSETRATLHHAPDRTLRSNGVAPRPHRLGSPVAHVAVRTPRRRRLGCRGLGRAARCPARLSTSRPPEGRPTLRWRCCACASREVRSTRTNTRPVRRTLPAFGRVPRRCRPGRRHRHRRRPREATGRASPGQVSCCLRVVASHCR